MDCPLRGLRVGSGAWGWSRTDLCRLDKCPCWGNYCPHDNLEKLVALADKRKEEFNAAVDSRLDYNDPEVIAELTKANKII